MSKTTFDVEKLAAFVEEASRIYAELSAPGKALAHTTDEEGLRDTLEVVKRVLETRKIRELRDVERHLVEVLRDLRGSLRKSVNVRLQARSGITLDASDAEGKARGRKIFVAGRIGSEEEYGDLEIYWQHLKDIGDANARAVELLLGQYANVYDK